MESDNGRLFFATGLDNSQLKNDADEASEILQGISDDTARQSTRIRDLLSEVPAVSIDFQTNLPTTIEEINSAFSDLDSVISENERAIKELEAEERRLAAEYSNTFQASQKEADAIRAQQQPIKDNIRLRKEIIQEAKFVRRELQECASKIQDETKVVQENETRHVSLRQRLREVKMELVELEAAGQRGSQRYRELQQEAGRLTDAWNDAQAQATILAHDQRGLQGIISGLSGIAGAASVAQGAIGLFGSENEHLQQIMLKVQSLMAITMGLQQVQQTLNKDSAFSLVTLNGLKEFWNKLTGESAEALEEENEELMTNTVAQEADAAATASDTAAQTSNNAATATGTTATIAQTTATKGHTAATIAQTVATKAASLAMKGLKLAIVSTGIGALIVLVGELVAWLMKLFDAAGKAEEEQKELNEIMGKGNEAYAKASVQVSDYRDKIERFNGTQEQEKQLVKELNSKFGEQMGYCKSLIEWKEQLAQKGEAYCKVLLKEAEAQALLAKYTEAYISLKEAESKSASEYGHWYTTAAGDKRLKQKAVDDAKAEANKWLNQYKQTMQEAQNIKDQYDLNPHIDTTNVKPKSGSGKSYDPEKAALNIKTAIEDYRKKVAEYITDANDELNDLAISAQQQGLARELNEIRQGTQRKLEAWNQQLVQLAEVRRATAKSQYMNTEGATEVGWANSEDGKKSIKDWISVIKSETPQVIAEFDRVWEQITSNGDAAIKAAQQKYTDALIEEFGTAAQREEKLTREWTQRLSTIPPEYMDAAIKKMEEEFASLNSDRFKAGINWESVFGNMSEQATPVLHSAIMKVKEYFEANKGMMSTEEIKNYQEAIMKMEEEISSRNPFASMQKAMHDLATSKTELTDALASVTEAQAALNEAYRERNAAMQERNDILERIEAGEIAEDSEEDIQSQKRLADALKDVTAKTDEKNKADQRVMNAQNKQTKAYKEFSNSLRSMGDVIGKLGNRAQSLASIFDAKVAVSIGKALDFMNEMVDATTSVIDAIGEVGTSVAKGVEATVEATSQGVTSAAAAGSAAISTLEKASVILTVISAAMQVATAIANLFNNDDAKQEEIERLQNRIDQLQWELNNPEVLRLQENAGKAIDIVNKSLAETRQELARQKAAVGDLWGAWRTMFQGVSKNQTMLEKSASRIADIYANMGYTVDKALGREKFASTRDQLENIAQQQLLIQEQINNEYSKKHTDHGKIDEWKQKIEELGQTAVELINNIVEEIIGGSVTDIGNELADAFISAFEAGEDAAEAWGEKVDEIVAGIVKQMLVTKFLEEPLGQLFDKYKSKWFPNGDGKNTIDNVLASIDEFTADLNKTVGTFSAAFEALPDSVKSLFSGDDDPTRQATQKGIAQASQDSVDELNGRATAIQGHTYQINENTAILVQTSNRILQSVINIDGNTEAMSVRMETVEANVKEMRNTLNDISLKGVKIQR